MTFLSGHGRTRSGDRHGWTSFQSYLTVHHRYLDELRYGFIIEDSLQYEFVSTNMFGIRGRIRCQHGLFLDVDKTLEVSERNQVRTINYSYHAGVEGLRDRPIFRYDNAHRYVREHHDDEHHRHRYDHVTWHEIEPPEWIGRDRWPHLSQVIDELQDW